MLMSWYLRRMIELNLPTFEYKLKKTDNKPFIYDIIRKKYIVLTPEEWVRQHFIHLLINQYQYPKALFAVETGLKYNKMQKRSDILILSRDGSPFLLVECKAPNIAIRDSTFSQIARYNFTIQPQFLAVTNGLNHFCFQARNGKVTYLPDFPKYEMVLE